MQISGPPRGQRRENILPMINVVFLLLIFFLISAELAPPEPFPVTPPEAAQDDPAEAPLTLYLDAEGQLGFLDATGEDAALAALQTAVDELCGASGCDDATRPAVMLRADQGVEGGSVAALLPKLGALGLRDVMLVTTLK